MNQATGVQTNGIGRRTLAHLNLTKTMADVAADHRDVLLILSSRRETK